jgi:hypothetical protein
LHYTGLLCNHAVSILCANMSVANITTPCLPKFRGTDVRQVLLWLGNEHVYVPLKTILIKYSHFVFTNVYSGLFQCRMFCPKFVVFFTVLLFL